MSRTAWEASGLEDVAEALEGASAEDIVTWAWERFGEDVVLAASFQDCVLIDVATTVAPAIEVVFLDTGYHFPETLAYVEHVRARYGLNLRVVRDDAPRDDRWRRDPDACCAARKVAPLHAALTGKAAWMSGVRRVETATRAATPVVHWDDRRGLVKVNPLATWSDEDVLGHVIARDLPVHPLAARGYASVGCWPCTRPVRDGENPRAGRWAGTGKTECGLHS